MAGNSLVSSNYDYEIYKTCNTSKQFVMDNKCPQKQYRTYKNPSHVKITDLPITNKDCIKLISVWIGWISDITPRDIPFCSHFIWTFRHNICNNCIILKQNMSVRKKRKFHFLNIIHVFIMLQACSANAY